MEAIDHNNELSIKLLICCGFNDKIVQTGKHEWQNYILDSASLMYKLDLYCTYFPNNLDGKVHLDSKVFLFYSYQVYLILMNESITKIDQFYSFVFCLS